MFENTKTAPDADFSIPVVMSVVGIAGIAVCGLSDPNWVPSVANVFVFVSGALFITMLGHKGLSTGFAVLSVLLAPVVYVKHGGSIWMPILDIPIAVAIGLFAGALVKVPGGSWWHRLFVRAVVLTFYMTVPFTMAMWVLSLDKYGFGYNVLAMLLAQLVLVVFCGYCLEKLQDRARLKTRIEDFVYR